MANELNEGGSMFVKVMTDEQMEVLRKQIAVYATICEQLVELHKSLTAQNDLSGSRLGSLYCDPLLTSNSHKISGRQRWSPTPMQLQILERIFNQGVNNPGKVKVPEITAELLQHGQVTETNVYNWFQNRRARSKRKQQAAPVNNDNNNINNNVNNSNNNNNNNTESEVETEDELLYVDHKKKQDEDVQNLDVIRSGADDLGSHEPGASSGVQYLVDSNVGNKPDTVLFQEGINKIGDSFEHVSFYGGLDDQLLSKMEVPGDYDSYLQQDEYNMSG